MKKSDIEHILDNFNMLIIVNGNPESRTKVEEGDLCLRSNENHVDLNRNWESHWKKVSIKFLYIG
jgi:hypothetical protein